MKLRNVRTSKELRSSAVAAAVLGALGGMAAAFLFSRLVAEPSLGLLVMAFGFGALLFALPVAIGGVLLYYVVEGDRQLLALVNLRPLYGSLPLRLGDSAVDPNVAERLVEVVLRTRPALVVECGSGSSTVLIAESLRQLGQGRVTSLDHEELYAEQTRVSLRQRDLDEWAEVIVAPLTEQVVAGTRVPWYATDFLESLGAAIGLLVVDGPPKSIGPNARYPAVPLLMPHLAPDCVILLDDGDRRDEASMVRRWVAELGGSLEYVRGGKGAWLIRRVPRA